MGDVRFIQYMRPDGRKKRTSIARPNEIVEMADALLSAGCEIAVEELLTLQVSMTVEDNMVEEYGALAHIVCENGPPVIEAVDRLITLAYNRKIKGEGWPPMTVPE